jgi:hypothetical protein
VTCSPRCASALALHKAYKRGKNEDLTMLDKDIAASSFLARRQAIIDDLLELRAGIDPTSTADDS